MSFNSIFGLGSHTGYDTLRGWWPLQETTGTTAYDYGISGFHGTISGMGANPTTGTGPTSWLSTAFTFDDTDNVVAISKEAAVKGNGERTLGGWVNPSFQGSNQYFCEFGDGNNGSSMRFLTDTERIYEMGGGYLTGDGSELIPTTGWSFVSVHYPEVTGTMYSSGIKIYIDLVQADVWETTKRTINTTFTKADVYIGGAPSKSFSPLFDGKLAGWFYFGKDMTASEMLEIYSGPEPTNYVAPTISGNTNQIGATLTCDPGTWGLDNPFSGGTNGTINYTYQWQRDGQDITDETGSTYITSFIDFGSNVTCVVSASNNGGTDPSGATLSNSVTLGTTSPYATGGAIAISGDYYIHIFKESGNFVPAYGMDIEYLVVGGGGGGGTHRGGGGGGGAVRHNISSPSGISAGIYSVIVGLGGSGADSNGNGSNGQTSVFDIISSPGGGYGGGFDANDGGNGGNGGGGAGSNTAGVTGVGGTGSYGYYGGRGEVNVSANPGNGHGGGGGGAGQDGEQGGTGGGNRPGDGGNGIELNIFGIPTYFGGGGGGGCGVNIAVSKSLGGLGGGGRGSVRDDGPAENGEKYTGGGGGGGAGVGRTDGSHDGKGREGGDGIVILRYSSSSIQNEYIYEMNTRVYVS